MRKCGECSLCCKLMPSQKLNKPANTKCQFQRAGKGCTIYSDIDKRPRECFVWRCRWLKSDEGTLDQPRPDRAGYVIDESPEFIDITDTRTGKVTKRAAIQIWVGDRGGKIPTSLKRYMQFVGHKGLAVICRYDSRDAMVSMIRDGQWVHVAARSSVTHNIEEILDVWTKEGIQL